MSDIMDVAMDNKPLLPSLMGSIVILAINSNTGLLPTEYGFVECME
jgi:hypothetical protein